MMRIGRWRMGGGRVRGGGEGEGVVVVEGRGKSKKVSVVEERNVEDVKGEVKREMKTRRTISSRKGVEEFVSLEMPVRRTRSSKIVEDVTVSEVEEESKVDEGVGNVGVVESARETGGHGKTKKVDVEELNGVEDVVLGDDMCRDLSIRVKSTRSSKNVGNIMARKDEKVENAGVVENKRTRGGRGRKKKTDVKELDEAVDSVRDDTRVNFLEIAGSEMVELRENLSKGVMDDVPQQNVIEGRRFMIKQEGRCVIENKVEGSLFAREQPCAKSMYDTVQLGDGDMLEVEAEAGDALSLNQKTISEPFDEVDQESEPKDEANIDVLEVEAREKVDDRAPQDEIMLGVEKQTPDKLENHKLVPAPDLEKMTLGEWFDYLEAYLPKQIYDVTDEIIDDMRKRAKQFDAFMLKQQQQKAKGKLPMTT
ncbi:hypothetical protein RND81_06G044400 [Saponaria officinalis]|uniref:Uncharacterized protein n=1 Tax=Saponaria officinalis TaxID=3572 RepID=A0AAW1K472_SAPOF